MSKGTSILLTIVRHGRTNYNCKKITQGQLDVPLDDVGIQQAIAAGVSLKDEHFDCVYSSDLSRAVRTASEIIKQNKGSSENLLGIKRDPLLRERGYGILEDKPSSDRKKAANEAGMFGQEEENKFVPSKGESIDEVFSRAKQFLDNLCSDFKDVSDLVPSRNNSFKILIVSHRALITQMIQYLNSKIPEDKLNYIIKASSIPNAGISKFDLALNDKGKIEYVSCALFCSDQHLINM
jgi:broad specificity phosphatase PhoE